ncbi:putative SWR1-complex protein 4 [Xylogone sp. PMI_703]|nr:putative SWR1-complex protein 4 [Xylogone sp. PMI_703]
MTSHDVRDMLDLPGAAAPRPAKKQKTTGPRPSGLKGLAREVQSLGGDNPIAIVPEISVFKKRRLLSRKPAANWELKAFKNSARGDEFILRHWRRKTEAPPTPAGEDGSGDGEGEKEAVQEQVEDSTFAKFNVKVNIPTYNDEEYNKQLQSEHWTKDETDYLMGLVQDYDLRWPIIWDRYDYQLPPPETSSGEDSTALVVPSRVRSMEELKARYYSVAAKMMAVRKPLQFMGQAEFNLHELMSNFNPAQEIARKKFAEQAFYRTKEEIREEESLLLELKRILARSEKLAEERRELYARLETPPSTGNIGIYTTSQGLAQLFQQLMAADKAKKRKSLMGTDGVSPAPVPSAQQAAFDRRESTHREPPSASSATAAASTAATKKGGQGPAERKKLTEEEERTYGVSHHERLTGGPAFRHEKINRPINTKSTVQQTKIANILAELEVPPRLIMPTATVASAFENLLHSINILLDSKKVADKLTAEIAVAKAHKEEKEKKARAENGEDGDGANADVEEDNVKVEESEKDKASSVRGSSVHKRSASVLSAVSDKSTKRMKK